MKTKPILKRVLFYSGLVFILGSVWFFKEYIQIAEHTSLAELPFRIPITLEKNKRYEVPFTLFEKPPYGYRVELDVERNLPFNQLNSLLGILDSYRGKNGLKNKNSVDID